MILVLSPIPRHLRSAKPPSPISFEGSLNDDVNIHSEAEMFEMEAPKNKAEASRTLQQVAMDTITTELNYQPKLKPRRPVWEQTEDRQINYPRGVNRPHNFKRENRQRLHQTENSSSRYDDSTLGGKLWNDSHPQVLTDSEADADTEDVTMDQSMDISKGNAMSRERVSGIPHASYQQGSWTLYS